MKTILLLLLTVTCSSAFGQIDNKVYNERNNQPLMNFESEIQGDNQHLTIVTDVIYNAVPDGYQVTYTTSFIGISIEDVENKMNTKMDQLIKQVGTLKIMPKDVRLDVVSLDPIFDFQENDSVAPKGYKVTENITFNIQSIAVMGKLAHICLEFGIYDLINAQAYLLDIQPIYDTLNAKTIELLNAKKKLCRDAGLVFTSVNPTIVKVKEVYYPSERYLKSYLSSANFYKHHVTQNSTMSLGRAVDVDNYYDFNLKDADYVYNAGNENPVIQIYFRLTYSHERIATEEEIREKVTKELEEKKTKESKQIYVLDENGELKKIEL